MTQLPPATGVFLSYSHEDTAAVVKLRTELGRLQIPVTIDSESMAAGQNIGDFIRGSIRSTRATIWIVSAKSLASGWVGVEMITSLNNAELWKGHQLIACYVDDDFFDDDFRLRQTQEIDGRIDQIEALIHDHAERELDSDDLDAKKSRLYKLRNNLGELLNHLRSTLCLDLRENKFDDTVKRLATTLASLGIKDGGAQDSPPSGRLPSRQPPPGSQRRSGIRWYFVAGPVLAAVVVWLVSIPRKEPLIECIETVYKASGVSVNKRQVELGAAVAKAGNLNLAANDQETVEFRSSIPLEVQLATLELCRARYVTNASGVGCARPVPMSGNRSALALSFTTRVTVKVGDRGVLQDNVRISSPNPGVRGCVTNQGRCDLTIENVKSTDTIVLTADVEGAIDKRVAVAKLATEGVTFEVPVTLRDFVFSGTDCAGKPLEGKILLEGDGIHRQGCLDPRSSDCRSAVLDNGRAQFRYDPAKAEKARLTYFPRSGAAEVKEVADLGGGIHFRSRAGCISSLRPCPPNVSATVANESRGALPAGKSAAVQFKVKSNRIVVVSAPEQIARQINGKPLTSPDCVGGFLLP
jgi:hypothetical protein